MSVFFIDDLQVVRWIENTLGMRRTTNPLWSGDPNFEFRVVDSPDELE